MRVISLDVWSFRGSSLVVQDGDTSSLNAVRRLRMLRELGCAIHHCADSAASSLVLARANVLDNGLSTDEEATDAASGPHAEAINQAISEMMARVQAEQIAIVEVWTRTGKAEPAYDFPDKTSHWKRLGRNVSNKASQIPRLLRWSLLAAIHLRHNTSEATSKRSVVQVPPATPPRPAPPQGPDLPTHRNS